MNSQPNTTDATRKPRRRAKKSFREHSRNDLYRLAGEFKRRNPAATGAEAWRHFAGLVGLSAIVLGYDAQTDAMTYVPDLDRFGTRQVKRRSFEQAYYRLTD